MQGTQPSQHTVLAFDIGIRNLAWCLMRKPTQDASGTALEILGWDNYDLLAGQSAAAATPSGKQTCCACSAKAAYGTRGGHYCVRHCPSDKPPLRDLSGGLLRGLPNAKLLRQILQNKGVANPPKSKGDIVKALGQHFALPLAKPPKAKKATDTEWAVLHDSLRRFVGERVALFRQATEICLENQPVLKNPTMKTVQILLYGTLRDCLQPDPPKIRLVHAKMKVAGKTKGDAGYKDRKQGSEERAKAVLEGSRIVRAAHWRAHLAAYTKKNDLTDALCMCLDSLDAKV